LEWIDGGGPARMPRGHGAANHGSTTVLRPVEILR